MYCATIMFVTYHLMTVTLGHMLAAMSYAKVQHVQKNESLKLCFITTVGASLFATNGSERVQIDLYNQNVCFTEACQSQRNITEGRLPSVYNST